LPLALKAGRLVSPKTGQTARQNPQLEHLRIWSRYFSAKEYLASIFILLFPFVLR